MIQSSLDLNAEFFPGNWDNAKVVVQTGGSTHNSSNSDELSIVPNDLRVRSSYLELTTSLWSGGPQWLVRMGDQSVSWSPLVQRPMDRKGLTVSNVNIRGINTRWVYLWGSSGELATAGIIAATRVGGVMLSGTYVDNSVRRQIALEGNTVVLDGLVEVQGGVSLDGGAIHAARAVLGWDPIPGWSLEGRHEVHDYSDPLRRRYNTQFSVSTQQFGTQFLARADLRDGAFDRTSITAQRPFMISNQLVRASYSVSILGDRVDHNITGQTTANIGVFKNVGLSGSLGTSGGLTVWRAQVSYSTPGGPSFNIQYDQSQRTRFRTGVSLSF